MKFRNIAILAICLAWMLPSVGQAYSGSTHQRIVGDAIDYMLDSPYATDLQRAAALYYLYKYNFTRPGLKAFMGKEAAGFDQLKDMYLEPTGHVAKVTFCKSVGYIAGYKSYKYKGNQFTALNHYQQGWFLDPARLWQPDNGYYYYHSSMSGDDKDAMDHWLIDYCDLKVNPQKSNAIHQARNSGSLDHGSSFPGSGTVFSDNFSKEIRKVRFAPIAALAQYRYSRFQSTGNLAELAYVFHAAADVTVPHHALGSHGLAHSVYETAVEDNYKVSKQTGSGYLDRDDVQIFRHLTQRPFLTRGLGTGSGQYYQVIPVYSDLAAYTAGYTNQQNPGVDIASWICWSKTGSCWNHQDMEHLLNLAIATTVRTFESAFLQQVAGQGKIWGSISSGSSFNVASLVKTHFGYGHEVAKSGDFNGDGFDDLITFVQNTKLSQSEKNKVYVSLNNSYSCNSAYCMIPFFSGTPMSFAASRQALTNFSWGGEVPLVGDFNGDGRDDIATLVQDTKGLSHPNRGGVYVALARADGSGTFHTPSLWISNGFSYGGEKVVAADFNGDGRDDLATFVNGTRLPAHGGHSVWVALSAGNGFQAQSMWKHDISGAGNIPLAGDFNGDGKDDVAVFVNDYPSGYRQARKVYVSISSGSALGAPTVWNGNFAWKFERPAVGDFDADGYDDIVTFVQDSKKGTERGDVWVGLNRPVSGGRKFSQVSKWHNYFSIRGEEPLVGRFNGDLAMDVVTLTR